MVTSKEILEFLGENKPILKERFYCSKVGLFGSFARNEQTDESDIDIIVSFKSDVPDYYKNEMALKEFIGKRFNRNVDICVEKWIKPVFKPLVINEAFYA